MSDVQSQWGSVYLSGDDILFKNNWVGLASSDFTVGIVAEPSQTAPPTTDSFIVSASAGKRQLDPQGSAMVTAKQTKQKFKPLEGIRGAAADVTEGMRVNAALETQGAATTGSRKTPQASGGVHIAGPSKNVFVVENEIQDGSRNGITLGNIILLDANGNDTGKLTGLLVEMESECSKGGTFTVPGSTGTATGSMVFSTGAGGVIKNVHIDRNLIRNMGMCGIGPVGFFDLFTNKEVIGIENLSITANVISNTMQRRMEAFNADASVFGYGAISLPNVENLTIRDNTITNFGATPGAEVCGIFVLHGEMVEISRNQIRETRDFHREEDPLSFYKGVRGGIIIGLATPTVLDRSGDSDAWESSYKVLYTDVATDSAYQGRPSNILYAPGLPALRIQENMVRVAVGLALAVEGYGPFSIVNNHFSSGGPVPVSDGNDRLLTISGADIKGSETSLEGELRDPLTVNIRNMGLPLELLGWSDGYASTYEDIAHFDPDEDKGDDSAVDCGGAVLFTNNICQLEAWGTGVRGHCSVQIVSLDHILFANNQLWFDGPRLTALFDAFLFGMSVQAVSNRFQEAKAYPVLHSAATAGVMNVTAQNISTYCLTVHAMHKFLVDSHNLVLHSNLCTRKLLVKTKRTGQTTEKEQATT